jgi:hypothetical protein
MAVLDDLRAVLDELVELDADVFADGELVKGLQRQFARLGAVNARAAASFQASGAWAPSGARDAAAWISGKCRLPSGEVRRRVRLGRCESELSVAAEAWAAGRIGEAHVAVLRQARRPGLVEAMARDEALLVGYAVDLPFVVFQQAVAYWVQVHAPDGGEGDAADLVERRSCHVSSTFEGMVRGDFELDPVRGAIVDETLREIYDEFFRADWAAASERLGREPTVEELGRTPQQRRADALVEMAIRARTAPKGGKRPRPLFSVYVDYDSTMARLCELANGAVITPGSLLPWLTEAEVERVVFDGKGRVIDIGRRRRLFRGATRRAVRLRDRWCYHPLCDQRAERCEIDHVRPYGDGGDTVTGNGQPACGFHNRWKHQQNQTRRDRRERRPGREQRSRPRSRAADDDGSKGEQS